MWQNEVLEEIYKIREEHAKSFDYDLDAMFVDWQEKQAESGRKVVNLSLNRDRTTPSSGWDEKDTSHCST